MHEEELNRKNKRRGLLALQIALICGMVISVAFSYVGLVIMLCCAVGLGVVIYYRQRTPKAAETPEGMLIARELQRAAEQERRLVSKDGFKRRIIYTIGCMLFLIVIVGALYASISVFWFCVAILLIYEHLFLSANTLQMLYKLGKKRPHQPPVALVEDETFDEAEKAGYKTLAICSVAALVLLAGWFVAGHRETEFVFEQTADGYVITGYYPALLDMEEVTIPREYKGRAVVGIGDTAFLESSYLQTVNMPDTITFIETDAFSGCISLTDIQLSKNITRIGACAFQSCEKLEAITLPDGLVSLGKQAFEFCEALQTISIPDGIIAIEDGTFFGCYELKSIELPSSVVYIGKDAFLLCENLEALPLPFGVSMEDVVVYGEEVTLQ